MATSLTRPEVDEVETVLSAPASSAPVDRVFSQSGLIIRPNRARMSDKMLEELVFLKSMTCELAFKLQ